WSGKAALRSSAESIADGVRRGRDTPIVQHTGAGAIDCPGQFADPAGPAVDGRPALAHDALNGLVFRAFGQAGLAAVILLQDEDVVERRAVDAPGPAGQRRVEGEQPAP